MDGRTKQDWVIFWISIGIFIVLIGGSLFTK